MSAQSPQVRHDHRPFTVAMATTAGLLLTGGIVGVAHRGPPGNDAAPATATGPAAVQPAAAVARHNGRTVGFSTFLGGRLWDEATDAEIDAAGNTYVSGFTLSSRFANGAAVRRPFKELVDAFVAKLSPSGTLLWQTFLGGQDVDVANSLALDSAGNAYVTGMTGSVDFPATPGTVQPAIRGRNCQGEPCHDAFAARLSPGGQIVYSTFLGGHVNDEGIGIAVDTFGRAYVTGNTDSADFPTKNAVQPTSRSTPCSGDLPCPYDAFVTKLDQNGRSISYSTYLGGKESEFSGGIAVDTNGSAYVTGATESTDFPTAAALSPAVHGRACGVPPGEPCLDAFVTKLNPAGNGLTYSTYLGGVQPERGSGIAVTSTGSAIVTGSTQSRDFPTVRALQGRLDNASCTEVQPQEQCDDGFVSKLAASGHSLVYSTYLGGQAEDQGLAVAVDHGGNAYVAGRTDSRNFPVRAPVFQPGFGGYIDGFATSITPAGGLIWSSFVGGKEADRVEGISVNQSLRIGLAGRTLSPNFQTVRPAQPELIDKDHDALVVGIR